MRPCVFINKKNINKVGTTATLLFFIFVVPYRFISFLTTGNCSTAVPLKKSIIINNNN